MGSKTVIVIVFTSFLICSDSIASDIYFEPSLGSWYGRTNTSYWYGGYVDLAILKKEIAQKGTWYWGIDTVAQYSPGRVNNGYRWRQISAGLGPEIQYFSSDNKGRYWQWQGKSTIEYENLDGETNTQQYMTKTQETALLTLYTEYLKVGGRKWLWGVTADGKIMLSKKIDSNIKSTSPEGRNYGEVNLLLQRILTPSIAGRFSTSGFYQGWNEKFGVSVSPELRIKETVIVGVRGAIAGNETSVSTYIRMEFGKLPKPAKKNEGDVGKVLSNDQPLQME